ncbi:cyclic nucleotide-binding domain-containing protein [Hydrogenophaga sp. MI9]|uniref:cyclic nucleotide-binding domain-containing protein n=1 Tax=Hydrogenophaga sp. MI9 TaxID=3453719 RepID=UPI003EF051D2
MNTATTVRPLPLPMPFGPDEGFTQQRFYAGDVLYTEGMPGHHLYVIKDGSVDIYMVREEKRVVVETLGPGQCFGVATQLVQGRRGNNAAARSYCELYLVGYETLERELGETPKFTPGLLRSLVERLAVAHELIATRVNYQPDILVYAQLLNLLGIAEVGRTKNELRSTAAQPVLASPLLTDVFVQARALLGHSDVHIRNSITKLLMLHLIRIDDEKGNGKRVIFSPKDIVVQARRIVADHTDTEKVDYEYVSVDEFAAMVDVDRSLLLKKLAGSEFAEDIFTFRKSEILRLLNDKGRKFFSDRKIKTPDQFTDVEDLAFADQKSLFDAVSRCDLYDLAKLLRTVEDEALRDKLLACLARNKREEVLQDMAELGEVDPMETLQTGKALVAAVREKMLARR